MYNPIFAAALTAVIGLHAQIISTSSIPVEEPGVDAKETSALTITPKELSALSKVDYASPISQKGEVSHMLAVTLTAYSSSPEETDDTPNITAMGSQTRHGIVATNMLPFGTKIKIPSLYGDEVFVVEDRMHPRMEGKVDIWMSEKSKALAFGSKKAVVVVLKN